MWQLYDYIFVFHCILELFYSPTQEWVFPASGMSRKYPAGVSAEMWHPARSCLQPWEAELLCWLNFQQYLIHFCRLIPKSVTNLSSPPSLECINYSRTQTIPSTIPTWCSYLRINQVASQRWLKGRGSMFVCLCSEWKWRPDYLSSPSHLSGLKCKCIRFNLFNFAI